MTRTARQTNTMVFMSDSVAENLEDLVEDEAMNMDEPAPEDYIVNIGDLDGEDDDDIGGADMEVIDEEPPSWYTSRQRIDELRAEYRRHEKDCGSPEFQVAGMTERIAYLTKHLKVHPKDVSTRRGLVALVNKRRRLLNYLYKENEEKYVSVVKSLGIRHKAPGLVPDRAEQYSRFPGQKAVKKHLVKK